MTRNRKVQNPRRNRAPRKRRFSPTEAYAAMVADPCNGPMLEGFYSSAEGMLNKLKTTVVASSTNNCGYVLWDPSFMSARGNPSSFNCVLAVTNAPSTRPLNTTVAPFGNAEADGNRLEVGAAPFCQSDTVSDARCVGACIRATYTGRMDAASGLVAVIDGIPAEAVLGVDGATPVTVEELFAMSSLIERASIDTLEVKYKPNDYSHVFRSNSEGVFNFETGVVTTITDEAERSGSHLMGFAFQGLTGMDDLLFEFHQNIEWRPNINTGFVLKIPKQIHESGHSQKVVAYLDKHHPNWWTNVTGKLASGATQLAKAAFTGSASRLGYSLLGNAIKPSLRVMAREAPLLLTL